MKAILIMITIALAWVSSAKADALSQIKTNLEQLQAAKSNSSGGAEQNNEQLTVETQRLIQAYVREADQNDWATPSDERLRRLGQVAEAVQPYTSLFVKLGTPSSEQQGSKNALNLLYFARPTNELKEELLGLANVPKPRGAARDAYDIIFNLGMATPDVREEVIKRMEAYQPNSYKSNAASEIYYSAGAEWRIKEAVPFYAELLQREYRNKDELNLRVRSIATAVRPLGPQAAGVLSLLQQHVARMKAEGADFRDINVIEGAIRSLEGKDPIEPLLAVNGAGPVGANPLPRNTAPTQAAAAQTTPIPPMAMPDQQPKSATSPTPIVQAESPKSFPWPWTIGAIFFLAVMGGVWFKFRRK